MATSSASTRTDEPEKMDNQDEDEQEIVRRMGWKALFSFTTKAHLPVLSVGFLTATVAALTLPVTAVLYGLIFREFADFGAGKSTSAVLLRNAGKYCLYLTAFGALNWLANSIYFMMFLTFGELQAKSARDRIFNVLLRKNMAWYDTRETGAAAFLPGIQMQIRDLQISVSQPFGEAFQSFVQTTGSLGVALYFSWSLTLVVVCSVPLIYIVMAFLSRLLSKSAHEQSDKLQQALKYVTNAIMSIETVKCFNGERFELQRYSNAIARAGRLYHRQANFRSMQLGFMQFTTLSIFVQGFWYGSHLVISGQRNAGQIVTTFWAAMMAVQGITGFLPQFIVLQKGKVAGARLRSLMAQISEADSATEVGGDEKPERCIGDLQLQKVSFAYPSRPEQTAIREASMAFPAGQTTFVIGRSGSGKSTLGQLLVRFYQPASGQIHLDGVRLEQLDLHWLRENITLVEQHSVLFDDSIQRNIAMGKKGDNVSRKDIEEAVEFAILRKTIEDLPNGFDTMLGLKGSNLSGGQRQRLALARARLRDTPVLILDESTSALDYITRFAILDAIRAWRRGKTTIIITHDISQIQPNDLVYVMDKAQVVEEGLRKVIEAKPDSAFSSYLHLQEQDEADDDDDSSDEETNEIMSLYDASWGIVNVPARPSSAIFFGESLLSPHLSPRQSPMAPILRRPSQAVSESEIEISPHGATKAPRLPASAARTLAERRRSSVRPRPTSVASHHSLSQEMSTLRPISFSPGNFPSNLSTTDDAPSFCKTFQAKMDKHRKRRKAPKSKEAEEPSAAVETLSIMHILGTVWPLVPWTARLTLVVAFTCALIHAAATPVFAYIFSRLLSTFFSAGNQKDMARTYALSILGIALADGLSTYGLHALFDISAQAWANTLKAEALRRILMQPREFFDKEENSVSRLAECLDSFAEEARNLPGRFMGIAIVVIGMITIAVIWSLISCWELTLVAFACGPIMFGITRIYNAVSNRWERFSNEADEAIGQVLHETFVNIRTVRCLVLEDVFRTKHKEATLNALRVGTKRAVYSGSIFGLNFSSVLFVSALLFWWGAFIIAKRWFTATQIIMTFNILMLSVSHVNYIGNYIPQINVSRDAASRLIRLARLPLDSHELGDTVQLFNVGDLTLNKVNFTYPTRKDHFVLHDVSFEIPRGSCTAIVGTSGSGKSTIAALLLKLYQTDAQNLSSPDISISNHDIKILHTSTLRSRIAIVSQNPVLFPGTITENIIYGLSPSSQLTKLSNVHAAASAAGIAEFIDSLPQGYQTVVGEGGSGLSGGQMQRLAIARALVRDPDILILDEATSALDVESAGIIRDTIQRLVGEKSSPHSGRNTPAGGGGISGRNSPAGYLEVPGGGLLSLSGRTTATGRISPFSCSTPTPSPTPSGRASALDEKKDMTVIIITHAREMMAIAEHVVMLDRGRVVQEGSFDELKRKKGPFQRLLRGEGVELPERKGR